MIYISAVVNLLPLHLKWKEKESTSPLQQNSRMSASTPSKLLQSPRELAESFIGHLSPADLAVLERTSSALQHLVGPSLYSKIYTSPFRPKWGTARLVKLLEDRPHLISKIHRLVLNEWNPGALQELVMNDFLRLESIILQYHGVIPAKCGADTLNLSGIIRPQPVLTNRKGAVC